ncbi:hTAFII28-like protein conserved region-domain-containing protein [Apodospora peruviana]|uniref:HTAFII28-like protein conserved region-domain-containing protein n=1 Tax=Apodospora peruviana TaxID=516989 RepID=A0AAE0MAJ4_9PEZI|nr:hTAFII28-like protein conserved region-domain-containing protein [Apodospora peruviana]
MASPPYNSYSPSTAHSPPYPSHSQLPPINTMSMTNKKRTSDGAASPSLKRRKASVMSVTSATGSAHPLRQTSFPPDEVDTPYTTARSPSVDSLVSGIGSQVSSVVGPPAKKKRGRKSKAEKAREQTPSVAGGRAGTVASDGATGRGSGGKSATGAGDEAEPEDDEPTQVGAMMSTLTQEQKDEEKHARGMLINVFTPDQFDRYEHYRAGNLSKSSVRRLVNATVSQSVTDNFITGMRAVTKLYIGDLIEDARRVQAEWIARTGEKQTDLPTPPPSATGSPNHAAGAVDGQEGAAKDKDNGDSNTQRQPKKDERCGPLRPDHLREALRRNKRAFEHGGVGQHALWNLQQQAGVERFPTRTGGRRIFR